ncbi:MAG: RsmE family RNA methyltransferase [Aquificae bacterium]|nr:RsmE family RNA methyltransferase [Aquificota bacterium]
MHVFYSEKRRGDFLILEDEEVRHFRVRRIRRGERFGVIYEGDIYICEAQRQEKNEVVCKILEKTDSKPPPKEVILYQCVTVELKTMDTIVRQATELGVLTFVPVISERSFRNKDAILKRIQKWERLVREAMKQSRRAIPMSIKEPLKLEEVEPSARENILLDNFHEGIKPRQLDLSSESFCVVVGPEGGFSERESRMLREKGFKSVLLEPYTLRSETATCAICSIIMNC